MKTLRGCTVALAGLIGFVVLLIIADYIWFASDRRQHEILASYIPEADCTSASFELLERETAPQDWLYVVRISGSDSCISSVARALNDRRAEKSTIPLVNGLLLPGHENPENEAVAFDFDDEDGSIIWTRDKR